VIKGLYAAASAMAAGLTRQNLLSHNLANIDTPGFKQHLVTLDDFLYTRQTTPAPKTLGGEAARVLGWPGLGVETAAPEIDFQEGALRQTGEPLDFALQGAGFFQVRTPDGDRYTRDGRFLRDADGQLVTSEGYLVLDAAGAPLNLPLGTVAVTGEGALTVDGQAAGQLAIGVFADPAVELQRDPQRGNLFTAAAAPTGTEPGTVVQGYLETANVNPAQIMTQMVAVGRAYEAAQLLVQVQDELLGRAISTISRL